MNEMFVAGEQRRARLMKVLAAGPRPRHAPTSIDDLVEARIAESERRFRAIVSQTTAGIAYVDRSGRLLFANERLLQVLGWNAAELPDKTIRDLTQAGDGTASQTLFNLLIHEGVPFTLEKQLPRRDGGPVWVNVSVSPIRDADGRIESAVAVVLDLSRRKRVEEDLHRSEAHLRSVLDSITDHAIITVDAHGQIIDWNVGAERLFGYTPDEAIGQSAAMIFTPEDRARNAHLEEIRTAVTRGRAMDERWHQRKDGSRFYVSGVLSPVGPVPASAFVKVARDETYRKHQQETLQHAHAQLEAAVQQRTAELRNLLERLITVQEDERRRIARDLHDDIGQKMTALHLKLETLRRLHRPGSDGHAQVQQAQTFVQQLDRDLDFVTWELRPAGLYDLGLSQALRDFISEWSKNYNVAATFQEVGPDGERLRVDQEFNLYRIAQEALNNIHKHAQAHNVEVTLQRRADEIVLTIEDDGIGFNRPDAAARGMGLVNMRERAALMNGLVEFERSASGGTTVIVRAPAVFAPSTPARNDDE